jgi:hypothetical protein
MRSSREPEVDGLLRAAGWLPVRRVPDVVARWRAALEVEEFVIHPAAEAVLREYGGLLIGAVGPGREMARSDLVVDPMVAAGERDRFENWLPELQARAVVPVGKAHHSHGLIGVAEVGEVFLLMDKVYARWPSFEAALHGLLLGLRQVDA